MEYETDIEKLKAQKPEGATIVAVKAAELHISRKIGKEPITMTFNRTMWVKTSFSTFH